MAGNLVNVPKLVKDILTRWSQAKADFVDDNISTKASQSTADSILSNTDTTTSSRAAQSTADSILANADTTTSSRASQSSVNSIPTSSIASIQRGTIDTSQNSSAYSGIDINISSVNTTKTKTNLLTNGWTSEVSGHMQLRLKNSTTITLIAERNEPQSSGFEAFNGVVSWEVIEYT